MGRPPSNVSPCHLSGLFKCVTVPSIAFITFYVFTNQFRSLVYQYKAYRNFTPIVVVFIFNKLICIIMTKIWPSLHNPEYVKLVKPGNTRRVGNIGILRVKLLKKNSTLRSNWGAVRGETFFVSIAAPQIDTADCYILYTSWLLHSQRLQETVLGPYLFLLYNGDHIDVLTVEILEPDIWTHCDGQFIAEIDMLRSSNRLDIFK